VRSRAQARHRARQSRRADRLRLPGRADDLVLEPRRRYLLYRARRAHRAARRRAGRAGGIRDRRRVRGERAGRRRVRAYRPQVACRAARRARPSAALQLLEALDIAVELRLEARLLVARLTDRFPVAFDRRLRAVDLGGELRRQLRRILALAERLVAPRARLEPRETSLELGDIDLGHGDLRLEHLETVVAQRDDIVDREISFEKHPIAARDLGARGLRGRLGLALALEPGPLLVGQRAFLDADRDPRVVEHGAVAVLILRRDAVAVMHDPVLVYPAVELLR